MNSLKLNKLILIKILFFITFIIFFNGCTHKIDITPNQDNITNLDYKIDKKNYNVAYYIENINLTTVSEGGGGDKISYLPYNETEAAFRKVLVKHFKKVFLIDNINNKEFISNNDIKLIFNYKINTFSSSDSAFTWPPTKFVVILDCKAIDKDEKIKWQKTLTDEAYASFDEFKNDFGLAGKRATENVFKKLLYELNTKELQEEK